MIILGIDPSLSSTGLCLINDKGIIIDCMSINHNLEDPNRLMYIYDRLMSVYWNYGPDHVAYERQVPQMRYNNSASSIVPLAELAGILKLSLLKYKSRSVYRYPPEDIKLFATGNGKATKEDMMKAVPAKQMKKMIALVPEWSVNDVSDAYHIANMTRQLLLSSVGVVEVNGKDFDITRYEYIKKE